MKRSIATLILMLCAAACGSSAPSGGAAPNPGTPATTSAPASTPGGAAPPSASAPPAADTAPAAAATPRAAAPVEKKPEFREITIPAGTSLQVTLATTVASDTSKVEDTVRGTLARPIVVDDTTVAPSGAELVGSVLDARQSGRVKGRASIAFSFNRLRVGDETHHIRTSRIAREAAPTKKKDAEKVGIGAGAGALIGAIAGGKKGAVVGGAVGAGAGGGVVAATRGDEVRLAAGSVVTTRLQEPVTVRVALR